MEKYPPLYFGVVAIEKGVLESPSTKVANFTYLRVRKLTPLRVDGKVYGTIIKAKTLQLIFTSILIKYCWYLT